MLQNLVFGGTTIVFIRQVSTQNLIWSQKLGRTCKPDVTNMKLEWTHIG